MGGLKKRDLFPIGRPRTTAESKIRSRTRVWDTATDTEVEADTPRDGLQVHPHLSRRVSTSAIQPAAPVAGPSSVTPSTTTSNSLSIPSNPGQNNIILAAGEAVGKAIGEFLLRTGLKLGTTPFISQILGVLNHGQPIDPNVVITTFLLQAGSGHISPEAAWKIADDVIKTGIAVWVGLATTFAMTHIPTFLAGVVTALQMHGQLPPPPQLTPQLITAVGEAIGGFLAQFGVIVAIKVGTNAIVDKITEAANKGEKVDLVVATKGFILQAGGGKVSDTLAQQMAQEAINTAIGSWVSTSSKFTLEHLPNLISSILKGATSPRIPTLPLSLTHNALILAGEAIGKILRENGALVTLRVGISALISQITSVLFNHNQPVDIYVATAAFVAAAGTGMIAEGLARQIANEA
ncbi:hypothetical protein HK102_009236, partial [Quaeritorhiza haematococci]